MYRNTIIDYEGRAYEVFWTSQFARHVCQNLYAGDNLHDLDHEAIVRVLANYEHVQEFTNGRCVFLSQYRARVYEIHVHLEQGSKKRPGRCTIKTCYQSNKQQYLELFR
jgi:hypothetical protein